MRAQRGSLAMIRMIPPLVFLVDHGHVRSHRLGEGGHHQADGGLPHSGSCLHIADGEGSRPTRFPKTSSGPGRFGFEGKNRSSPVPSIVMVAAKAHATAENIMKLVQIRRRKDGPDGPARLRSTRHRRHRQSGCARAGRSHFARHSQRHPERQRKLGSVDRALGAGANWIATTGVVGVSESRPTASGHLPC